MVNSGGVQQPELGYVLADLDLYGAALIEQGKADEAYKIYEKIAKDDPHAGCSLAQTTIEEAQATSLFGMASALDGVTLFGLEGASRLA